MYYILEYKFLLSSNKYKDKRDRYKIKRDNTLFNTMWIL